MVSSSCDGFINSRARAAAVISLRVNRFVWASFDFPMSHMKFPNSLLLASYEFHMNFIWFSCESHMNFIWALIQLNSIGPSHEFGVFGVFPWVCHMGHVSMRTNPKNFSDENISFLHSPPNYVSLCVELRLIWIISSFPSKKCVSPPTYTMPQHTHTDAQQHQSFFTSFGPGRIIAYYRLNPSHTWERTYTHTHTQKAKEC